MKTSKVNGWKDIFSFTFTQTVKSKSYRVSFAILIILCMVSMPIVNMIFGNKDTDENKVNAIETVYVDNESGFTNFDFSAVTNNDKMQHIVFEPMTGSLEDTITQIDTKDSSSVVLHIYTENGQYAIDLIRPSDGNVDGDSLDQLGSAVSESFLQTRIENLSIEKDQLDLLNAEVISAVTKIDTQGNVVVKEDTSISNAEYWFIYGIFFFVMMTIMTAGTQVASSIVTDKSSKVIECLLTSVRPMAIIVGKVLAMLCITLVQLGSMVVCLFASNLIAGQITGKPSALMSMLPDDISANLNIGNIILCFVMIALGLIFYATLAGLAGSACSKIEEMSEHLTVFTMTTVVGAYLGIAAAVALMASGESAFVTFAYLFPLSSPFILPGAVLIGKVSIGVMLGAMAIELVVIILLVKFVAKVYETLIYYNGNKIKLKDWIKMSKTA